MLNEQKITDKITIGGRPDAAEIAKLKARGFVTVINLLTDDEPGALHEEQLVEDAGLSYAAIPTSPALLDDIAMARFEQAIESSDGMVAVHCKGGGRAGLLTLVHLAIAGGWDLTRTHNEAAKMGVKLDAKSPYLGFVESYIHRHSAGERVVE